MLDNIGHLLAKTARQVLSQHAHWMFAGHHESDAPPFGVASARPEPTLIDQRQQTSIHQRGLAATAVAADLQPPDVAIAGAGVETGERVQGLLLPAEEKLGLIYPVRNKADEGTPLEARTGVGHNAARANLLKQTIGQRINAIPLSSLKKPKEGRKRVRPSVAQQDRIDRYALGVIALIEMTQQRHLGFGPNPALHAVAPH